MKLNKFSSHLEVEHNGTTFQVPKQFGEKLYIRLLYRSKEDIIIQIEFPDKSPDPTKLAMSYNMEPEKRNLVTDNDLQNIGEALMYLTGVLEDEQHSIVIEESNIKSLLPEENISPPQT